MNIRFLSQPGINLKIILRSSKHFNARCVGFTAASLRNSILGALSAYTKTDTGKAKA